MVVPASRDEAVVWGGCCLTDEGRCKLCERLAVAVSWSGRAAPSEKDGNCPSETRQIKANPSFGLVLALTFS